MKMPIIVYVNTSCLLSRKQWMASNIHLTVSHQMWNSQDLVSISLLSEIRKAFHKFAYLELLFWLQEDYKFPLVSYPFRYNETIGIFYAYSMIPLCMCHFDHRQLIWLLCQKMTLLRWRMWRWTTCRIICLALWTSRTMKCKCLNVGLVQGR